VGSDVDRNVLSITNVNGVSAQLNMYNRSKEITSKVDPQLEILNMCSLVKYESRLPDPDKTESVLGRMGPEYVVTSIAQCDHPRTNIDRRLWDLIDYVRLL